MPTFTVKSPDGRTYKVNGPEGSTAAQARERVQAQIAASKPLSTLDTLQGAAGRFADGVFPGSAAATRGVRGVIDNAANAVFHGKEWAPAKAYAAYAQAQQRIDKKFAQDHPTAASAAGWTGFGASFALPGVKAVNAERYVAQGAARLAARGSVPAAVIAKAALKRRTAATLANGAATGGAYGVAGGALQGEGTDRIANALEGGIAGTALGAVAHPLVSGITGTARAVGRSIAPHLSTAMGERIATSQAQRQVGSALSHGDLTPVEAAADLQRRTALGVPAMPADLTASTQQATGHALRKPGPGQTAVREAISQRQRNMAARVQSHIDSTLGPIADPHAQSEALTRQGRTAAAPLYDAAYQATPVVTPGLREFMDSPQGRSAMAAGTNDIANTPTSRRNIGSEQPTRQGVIWDPDLDGYRSGPVPVMEAFDGAKRHLDNIVYDGQNRFVAKTAGTGTNTRPTELQRQELLAELDFQNPAYAEARAAYAGPTADRQAFETGLQGLPGTTRHTVPDAASQMGRMNPSQMEQMRLGDRTRLANEVGATPTTGDATAPLGGNGNREALIRHIHGPEAADRLTALTAAERGTHDTFTATDRTPSAVGPEGGRDATASALSAGRKLAIGRPIAAAADVLGHVLGGGTQGSAQRAEVARIMTTTGADASQAMRLVAERADRDLMATMGRQRVSGQLAKVGAIQAVGNSGDDTGMYEAR